ncbi:putative lipoprotein with Yx(FWY)xxD motif [Catenuloplanes nepalensis]|uniref:Lipoprotein with Yx(FWY)xxD motif n=1 Tax=Catenuloplanes nepalensis TaxID=587533 RepID=A0ABT9MPT3_9ACTN|nr:hypothetical protein [Catenuloplanes nepalensis]MDP9793422.1 putative lipoprotein with Yx(FWY)xxD motif [Catenuloplanes nepalensis]
MSGKRSAAFTALLLTGSLLLSACGGTGDAGAPAPAPSAVEGELNLVSGTAKSNDAPPKTGDWAVPEGGPAPEGEAAESAKAWVQLNATKATPLKKVVVNGAGLTLYRFDEDTAKPSKATCDDACAKVWPPVVIKNGGKVFVAGIKKDAVGYVVRADGQVQLTLYGWPMYRFAGNKDKAADTTLGDINGQGVGGTWFGITPTGEKAVLKDPAGDKPGIIVEESPAAPATGGAASVTFFSEPGFADSGFSEGVTGPGCKNLTTTANEASSMTATGSVKIWADKDCKGKSFTVNGDVDDLAETGLDDQVESVRFL